MTIRMRSLKAGLPIGGRRMKLGQEFDVPGHTMKNYLVVIKAAEVVPPAVAVTPVSIPATIEPQMRSYVRKDVIAEVAPPETVAAEATDATTQSRQTIQPSPSARIAAGTWSRNDSA